MKINTVIKSGKAQEETEQLNKIIESESKEAQEMQRIGMRHEASAHWRKYEAASRKLRAIEETGLSSLEQKYLTAELSNMFTINSSRDISGTTYEVAGFVPKIGGAHFKVRYTQYSSLMRNVKGCKGLAHKISIHSVKPITPSAYQKIVEGVKAKGQLSEVSFWGAYEKHRGNQLIPKNEPIENLSYLNSPV